MATGTPTTNKIGKWLAGNDTGASSKTLAAVALGAKDIEVNIPYDVADLGRCIRFMDLLTMDEAAEVMRNASELDLRWSKIFGEWGELVELYREAAKTPEPMQVPLLNKLNARIDALIR